MFLKGSRASAAHKRLAKVYGHAPLPLIYPEKITKKKWLEQSAAGPLAQHRAIRAAMLEGHVPGARERLYEHLIVRYATAMDKALKRARTKRRSRPAAEAQMDR